MTVALTEFARARLFPRQSRRNAIRGTDAAAFEQYINAHLPMKVLEGYAPFCQLWVYSN